MTDASRAQSLVRRRPADATITSIGRGILYYCIYRAARSAWIIHPCSNYYVYKAALASQITNDMHDD